MKDDILKLRKEGYNYDDIAKKLGCSKGTISYHCKKFGLGTISKKLSDEIIIELNEFYKTHTVKETANHFKIGTATVVKYCLNKRVLLTQEEKRVKNIKGVKRRCKNLKIMSVSYKGGCCQECGYHRCVDALEFHHLDPTQKDFGISEGSTRSWEKVKIELDKCIMLCSNCHKEVHAGLIEIKL